MTTLAVNLSKGESLNLSKNAPSLKKAVVGLGWQASAEAGKTFDLDAQAWLLNAQGKAIPPENFVFYNNLKSNCGSVVHSGDNLTGGSSGDAEQITIDLDKVPQDIYEIHFSVTIHKAHEKGQRFGQVKNAYVRVFDADTNTELGKCDLTEDSSGAQGIVAAMLYRHNGEWKFKGIGDAILNAASQPTGNLQDLCNKYGVQAQFN